MSVRANSLRNVFLDSLAVASLCGLLAAFGSSLARGAEDSEATPSNAEIAADRRLTDDHIDSRLNTDDNMPSGNPTESAADEKRTHILGMELVERQEGDIRVVDVTATSPAWNAGIRKGDRLMSIHTLKPRALAPWVDDIGRVLAETPDGQAVSAAVERDGERLALRIQLPVSRAAEARDARQEEEERADAEAMQGRQGPGQQEQQQGQMPTQGAAATTDRYYDGHGGYGSGLGGWGGGGFFGDTPNAGDTGEDRMASRALARLMRVDTFTNSGTDNAGNLNRRDPRATTTGGQVGIAAFQDTEQGVRTMVVVRGLTQGSYRVGIGQGDMAGNWNGGAGSINGGINNGQFNDSGIRNDGGPGGLSGQRNQATRGQQQVPGQQQQLQPGQANPLPGQRALPNGNPALRSNQPGAIQPSAPGGGAKVPGGGMPQGGAAVSPATGDGASLSNPRGPAFLAQQMEPQQPANQQPTPGMGTNQPMQNPSQPSLNDSNNQRQRQWQTGRDPSQFPTGSPNDVGGGGMGPGFTMELGVLQVGADGSGQVENQLEGINVRSLVGQSVMVVSTMSQGGGFVPGQAPAGQGSPIGSGDPRLDRTPDQGNPMATSRLPQGAGFEQGTTAGQGGQGTASPGLVATGVIQLADGGQLPSDGQQQTGRQRLPADRRVPGNTPMTPPDQQFPSQQQQ